MIFSMTGFASKTFEIDFSEGQKLTLFAEMKSLNSRFFEATCRMPSGFSCLETEILSVLKNKVFRGRIYLTITSMDSNVALNTIEVSLPVAKGYINALNKIKKEFGVLGEITISDLVHFEDIFVGNKPQLGSSAMEQFLVAINELSDDLMKVRFVEGSFLQKYLLERFDLCKKYIDEISKFQEVAMNDQKQLVLDMNNRLQAGEVGLNQQLELLYESLNKIDIEEEIARFINHLEVSRKLLSESGAEKGKRFDFLFQELLREANTIAAKCSTYEISARTVEIKVELEKAREQVQNIL